MGDLHSQLGIPHPCQPLPQKQTSLFLQHNQINSPLLLCFPSPKAPSWICQAGTATLAPSHPTASPHCFCLISQKNGFEGSWTCPVDCQKGSTAQSITSQKNHTNNSSLHNPRHSPGLPPPLSALVETFGEGFTRFREGLLRQSLSLLCWSSLGAVPHCLWERLAASVSPAHRKRLFILIIIIIIIIACASERNSPPCSLCSQQIKSVGKSTTKISPLLPSRGTDPLPCGNLNGTLPRHRD